MSPGASFVEPCWLSSSFRRKAYGLPEEYTDPFGNKTTLAYDSKYDLFIESSTDPLGNAVSVAKFDFRVLAPSETKDPNDNYAAVAFDALGLPVASAIMGKSGTESGDKLDDVPLDIPVGEVRRFFTDSYSDAKPKAWLDKATARFIYNFGENIENDGTTTYGHNPAAACAILREQHVNTASDAMIQVAVEFSDGSGNVFVKKSQAEPDPKNTLAKPPMRWIASGKTVVNNKGKPVKQYEPYFSDNEHRFDAAEAAKETGVTPIMFYDAVGRLVRTESPDGSFSRVEFSPWYVKTFDANDTVLQSKWYADRGAPVVSDREPTDPDRRAAWLAAHHSDTPSETHLDSLGREVVSVAHNKFAYSKGTREEEKYITFTKLDAEGKPLWIRDARGNLVMQYIAPTKRTRWADEASEELPATAVPCYDVAGNLLFQHSMDADDRWMINDSAGKPMFAWDQNDQGPGTATQKRTFRTTHDELHRPIKQFLKIDAAREALIEEFAYCDTNRLNGPANLDVAKTRKLIGQAIKHWDPSGLATVEEIDLSGKPAHVTRTLIKPDADGGSGILDWGAGARTALLEDETFRQLTEYDALGRMTLLYNWHRDITFDAAGGQRITPGNTNRVAVYQSAYNLRGALTSEALHIRASKTTDAAGRVSFTIDPTRSQQAIKAITYNEKGQKLSLELGNNTITKYTYDVQTYRLTHLFTKRSGAIAANDCTSNSADDERPSRPCGVQNLHYTYDPVGNITHIQNDAQQTIYFSNSRVEPSNDYTYDALYRLIEATGRENAVAVAPPRNREDPWPNNGFPSADALRNYTQRYFYDSVGNFIEMVHLPDRGSGWTRHYTTQQDSNRLAQTWFGNNRTIAVTYHHDSHGNMLNLNRVDTPPALDPDEQWGLTINWDWRDMIRSFDLGGGGQAGYFYGIDKQRSRKYIARNPVGNLKEDRIYLGGYELYRRYRAIGDDTTVEEIESHHLFEGELRILLVDDVIIASDHAHSRPDHLSVKPQTLFRYQYNNNLGSVGLEVDQSANIISYEEFHPYGTSAYCGISSRNEAPAKRYRYTGRERDDESGFTYHGARYYMPWLGRWASPEPQRRTQDQNLYQYVENKPVDYLDRDGLEIFYVPEYHGPQIDDATAAGLIDTVAGFPGELWTAAKERASAVVEGVKHQWKEGSTADRVEIVATGVGTASGAVPYFGDYVSLGSSVVAFGAKPSWENAAGAALDIPGALLPIVPAMGTLKRAEKLAEAAHDVEKAAETGKTVEKFAEPVKDTEKVLSKEPEKLAASARDTENVSEATGEPASFLHGTTTESAESISGELKAVSTNTAPYPEGSFFTHAASEPNALEAASHWPVVQGKAPSSGVSVIEMSVPPATLQSLEARELVRRGSVPGVPGFPTQTVFLPGALEELNATATFRIIPPSF